MACSPTLATIAAEQCPSKPGLKTVVALAYASDIASIGAAVGHAVSTITMVATKTFKKLNVSRRESEQGTVPGDEGGYTTTAKYFITLQEAAKSTILNGLNGTEGLVAITIDQNGDQQIIGALDHPVRIKVGATKTPRNGYSLEIMWEEHDNLPLHFSGTIPYV